MGYLKTLLTYHIPSEAEVDKAFLESRGISACLLNANTARNELGAPFFVRLQVMEEDFDQAFGLIKEANPSRFGSVERVNEIDRLLKRSLARFFLGALPLGALACVLAYLLLPVPDHPWPVFYRRGFAFPDVRTEVSVFTGLAACILATWWLERKAP